MIDEKILYEQAPTDLIDSWADKEDFVHGWNSCNKEWQKKLQEISRIGVWIPTNIENPEYTDCKPEYFVTLRRKSLDDSKHRLKFTTKAIWSHGKWLWSNGKPIEDNWNVLAWQKLRYPDPYEGE